MGIGQTEQTEIWVLARPNRPKCGYWPDQTDQKIWVLARPNRPKYGYWPDRTDQNMGIRETEQTKIAIGQTEGVTQIFFRPLWTVAPEPPVRDPSRSGQYLSWVADFILGHLVLFLKSVYTQKIYLKVNPKNKILNNLEINESKVSAVFESLKVKK